MQAREAYDLAEYEQEAAYQEYIEEQKKDNNQ